MDAAGIDRQVLSPNPLTYFHHIPAERAAAFCRRGNDLMAEAVARHPDRLLGTAALPLQDVDAALVELDRAVRELGLVGPYIGSELGGRALDDAALRPVLRGAGRPRRAALRAPVPRRHRPPGARRAARAVGPRPAAGVRLRRDAGRGRAGLRRRLRAPPDLDVCISHGGGAAPYLFGRLAAAATKRRWSPERLRAPGAFAEELRASGTTATSTTSARCTCWPRCAAPSGWSTARTSVAGTRAARWTWATSTHRSGRTRRACCAWGNPTLSAGRPLRRPR